ncbi:MAG: DUF2079 domain-containing protein [Methylococcales bacterium]
MLLYIIIFSVTSILTFRNFGMSAYDIGIHDQAIWKLATGRGIFNTIRGLNIWGDHCWFIFVLLSPLYWIAPRIETLLIGQSVALSIGALPIAILTYRKTGSQIIALCLAVTWLISPVLQNMNLENFHPEVIVAPFLLWAIERADLWTVDDTRFLGLARQWWWYEIAVVLALLCKEDVALTIFFIGLWVAVRHNRREGIITMVLSVLWFVLCLKVFLPYFNQVGFFRFSSGYWFSTFWEHKFEPGFYWNCISSPQAAGYLWKLGIPVLFLACLDPLLLLAALPSIAINLLSQNNYLISIDYHYNNLSLPMIFAATACGIAWLVRNLHYGHILARLLTVGMVASSVLANDAWSHLPMSSAVNAIQNQYKFFSTSGIEERFRRMESHLPKDPDVAIAVSHNMVPHLTHRNEIYMFPNPWKTYYWGINGENVPSPKSIQTLFMDRAAIGPEVMEVFERLIDAGEFSIIAEEDTLIVARQSSTH